MRRVRYQVAVSLDGYIAGPNGEADWIVMDPEVDFEGLFAQFDTLLMGRKTFLAAGAGGAMPGTKVIVFSRTLAPARYPKVQIVASDPGETVRRLKSEPGKDIWLFGGGELFQTLLRAKVIDTIEPAIMPVVLGGGIPMFPSPLPQTGLTLRSHRRFEKSGIVVLEYALNS